MGFWKDLRTVLTHPDIVNELEVERTTRLQLSRALAVAEDQVADAEMDFDTLEGKLDRAYARLNACQAALRALCSRPPTNEQLKQIYEAVAPVQDPRGFHLYFSAQKLTGIELSDCFPYEDNRGLFEGMDGRQLLRWLTAAHFQAVDWAVVPGTTYERATLREMDTSTPKYQAFEKQLYEKALERMGFQNILEPHRKETVKAPDHLPHQPKRGDAR